MFNSTVQRAWNREVTGQPRTSGFFSTEMWAVGPPQTWKFIVDFLHGRVLQKKNEETSSATKRFDSYTLNTFNIFSKLNNLP